MSARQAAEQLHESLVARARLIERARDSMADGRPNAVGRVLNDVLLILEQIQRNDEGLLRLHAECIGLVELASRVLNRDATLTPTVFRVER